MEVAKSKTVKAVHANAEGLQSILELGALLEHHLVVLVMRTLLRDVS